MQYEKHQFAIDICCDHCDRFLSDIVTEKQRQLSEATKLLESLIGSYDRMPDGDLGKGLTNADFLNAKEWLGRHTA